MRRTGSHRLIAYFSMEIAVDPRMPTYSGGLGILAGDFIRTAADMEVPMVGVTLLHRKGYVAQKLTPEGVQQEEPMVWEAGAFLEEMPQRASVELEGRNVYIRAWRYQVTGITGFVVPVYFLDTDLKENTESDRTLTHVLYGGDAHYRLCQEAVFGIGGVRVLRVLGYEGITRLHMNEGHAALLTLALLDGEAHRAGRTSFSAEDVQRVREKCVFTTHTPISAGHDRFEAELVEGVLNRPDLKAVQEAFFSDSQLNMTELALRLSGYVNGVSRKHGQVAQGMFASCPVGSVTNGVHVPTWTCEPFQALFDRFLPDGWRQDNFLLRNAFAIPSEALWQAHLEAKRQLLAEIRQRTGADLELEAMTIGFGRRATGYKRADLFLSDPDRLRAIVREQGPFQVVYAGKAHPHDPGGKEVIRRIFETKKRLQEEIRIVYLENYDMTLARKLVAGVDLWLNTPQPPLEASGTSGMKAALNGVPSLSVLDGWWIEGHLEGVTGWAIGSEQKELNPQPHTDGRDAALLYDKLEGEVLPAFYQRREDYIRIMRQAITLNGSYFHSQRMLHQYLLNAYF